MTTNNCIADYELIYIIVNYGHGSKVLHTAKQFGINGGSITLGRGTVSNKILEFLGLSDIRKEIVLIAATSSTADDLLEKLDEVLKFDKPNHGIAFTIPVMSLVGTRISNTVNNTIERGEFKPMYHSITTIVEKGKAEDVIDAATKAGSKGGTIINGRGSGIHETSKLFHMDIEPEKEIVLILSEPDKTDAIVESIRNSLNIDKPGNGIIFIQEVNKAHGLVTSKDVK